MANPTPIPTQDAIVITRDWVKNPDKLKTDPEEGRMTDVFIKYIESIGTTLNQATISYPPSESVSQSGAIGTTPMNVGTLSGGIYRFTYYLAITVPASVNSSIQVVLTWLEGGASKSHSFTAFTGNTITSTASETYSMRIDGASPVSYSTVYSATVTPSEYNLYLVLELLNR